ncbi:MurR/RpiR family transcriptional regulator [Rhizobium sp. BR 314]|uniref:MurR/RpiR family transcriptional regulator n=1 Tax=Rhizobium sp. BR 314 TaxID=3040013 RepID=UPI0039BF4571
MRLNDPTYYRECRPQFADGCIMKRQTSNSRPRDLGDLKKLIAARAIVFTRQSERVARLAIEKPEVFAFGTLQSIAAECCVGPTTVARAAKMAGFESFADFKDLVREHFKATPPRRS